MDRKMLITSVFWLEKGCNDDNRDERSRAGRKSRDERRQKSDRLLPSQESRVKEIEAEGRGGGCVERGHCRCGSGGVGRGKLKSRGSFFLALSLFGGHGGTKGRTQDAGRRTQDAGTASRALSVYVLGVVQVCT